jgi:hypothetical protein
MNALNALLCHAHTGLLFLLIIVLFLLSFDITRVDLELGETGTD